MADLVRVCANFGPVGVAGLELVAILPVDDDCSGPSRGSTKANSRLSLFRLFSARAVVLFGEASGAAKLSSDFEGLREGCCGGEELRLRDSFETLTECARKLGSLE